MFGKAPKTPDITFEESISTLPTVVLLYDQIRGLVGPGKNAVVLLHHQSSDLVYQLAKIQFVDHCGSPTLILTAYSQDSGKLRELNLRKIDTSVSSFTWVMNMLESAKTTEQRVAVGFKGNIVPILSVKKIKDSDVVILQTASMQVNK